MGLNGIGMSSHNAVYKRRFGLNRLAPLRTGGFDKPERKMADGNRIAPDRRHLAPQ